MESKRAVTINGTMTVAQASDMFVRIVEDGARRLCMGVTERSWETRPWISIAPAGVYRLFIPMSGAKRFILVAEGFVEAVIDPGIRDELTGGEFCYSHEDFRRMLGAPMKLKFPDEARCTSFLEDIARKLEPRGIDLYVPLTGWEDQRAHVTIEARIAVEPTAGTQDQERRKDNEPN